MADIDKLKKSPSLDAIIRKAANKMGDNHARTKDTHGMVLSNEGESHQYTSSNGRHPSRLNTSAIPGQEVYRVLGEEKEKEVEEMEKEEEVDEATGASSAGSYSQPLFGDMKEDDEEAEKIVESVIKEKVEKILLEEELDKMVEKELEEDELEETGSYGGGFATNYSEKQNAYDFKSQGPFPGKMTGNGYNFVSQGPLNEEMKKVLKKKLVKKLKEQYTEKPIKSVVSNKNTPGIEVTDKTLKLDKKENDDYYDLVDKKMKDYLDIPNNSHPEFPHQNNSKTDYKSPMYRNTTEEEEFIDDFRGMGLEDANGVDDLERLSAYLGGSQETGNAQTDKEGNPLGNVVPTGLGKKIEKKIKRKKDKIAYRKSKMTNLRGFTPDVQTVSESVKDDIKKIKHLFNYSDTTQ